MFSEYVLYYFNVKNVILLTSKPVGFELSSYMHVYYTFHNYINPLS